MEARNTQKKQRNIVENVQSWVSKQAIKMDKFLDKKYKLVRSENFEELLAEIGVCTVIVNNNQANFKNPAFVC